MSLPQHRRLAALILAAAGAAACGAASAADANLYFGAKGGIMSSDRSGYGDALNAGGVVGLHFMDFGKGKSQYGSLSGEVELTVPVVKGDVNPSIGKWSAWTVGAGAVHRNLTSSPSGIPGTGSSDDPAFGVGVGYRLNRRNSIEFEVTVMDTLTFISAGFIF